MLVRGLWLDRLITAREKSAASRAPDQRGVLDACYPFETRRSTPGDPVRSRWSGALQPSKRQSSAQACTTNGTGLHVRGALPPSLSSLASATMARCKAQLRLLQRRDPPHSQPLKILPPANDAILKALQTALKFVASSETVASHYQQWSSMPPPTEPAGANTTKTVKTSDLPSSAQAKIAEAQAAFFEAVSAKGLATSEAPVNLNSSFGTTGQAHNEDLLGQGSFSWVPAGLAKTLNPNANLIVRKRDKDGVFGQPYTVPVGSVEWPWEKAHSEPADDEISSETTEPSMSSLFDARSIDSHSERDLHQPTASAASSPKSSLMGMREKDQLGKYGGTGDAPLDSPMSIPAHCNESSADALAIAPTDPPLPWTSKGTLKRSKVIKAPAPWRSVSIMNRLAVRALDVLRHSSGMDQKQDGVEHQVELADLEPHEKVIEETDRLDDISVAVIGLSKSILIPPTQVTSFKTVIALGTVSSAYNDTLHRLRLPQAKLDTWLEANPHENPCGRSFLFDCLLPGLVDVNPSVDNKAWAVALAEYLLKIEKIQGAAPSADNNSECKPGDKLFTKDRPAKACFLAIGFVACLDELCALPSLDSSRELWREVLVLQARAKATITLLQKFQVKVRTSAHRYHLPTSEERKKIKKDALRRLSHGESEFYANALRKEYIVGKEDCKLITLINNLHMFWRTAWQTAFGTKERSGAEKEKKMLLVDISKRLKSSQAGTARGLFKGSIYDLCSIELQGRGVSALLRAVRLGVQSPEGFQHLLVFFMQRMRFASTQLKEIICLAQRDNSWEAWPPPLKFAKHLQGLRALHQYWRKSSLGKEYSDKVEEAVWQRIEYTNTLVRRYSKHVCLLLKIAKEAKEASVAICMAKGRLLRYDAQSSIRLLDYLSTLSKHLGKESDSPKCDELKANLHLQCINLALALLWKGDHTEKMDLGSLSAANSEFGKYIKALQHGGPMCLDCMAWRVCDTHRGRDLMHKDSAFDTRASEPTPKAETKKRETSHAVVQVGKAETDSPGRGAALSYEERREDEFMTLEAHKGAGDHQMSKEKKSDGTGRSEIRARDAGCADSDGDGKVVGAQDGDHDKGNQGSADQTAQQSFEHLKKTVEQICKTNTTRNKIDTDYFNETFLPRVRTRLTEAFRGTYIRILAITVKKTIDCLQSRTKGVGATGYHDRLWVALCSRSEALTKECTGKGSSAEANREEPTSAGQLHIAEMMAQLCTAIDLYYQGKTYQAKQLLTAAKNVGMSCASNKSLSQLSRLVEQGDALKKEADDWRIIDCFTALLSTSGQEYTGEETEAAHKSLVEAFCRQNAEKQRRSVEYLTKFAMPVIEDKEDKDSLIVNIGALVDSASSMLETLEEIDRKAKRCGVEEQYLARMSQLQLKGARYIDELYSRQDVKAVMLLTEQTIVPDAIEEADCLDFCEQHANCLLLLFKEAIIIFYTAINKLATGTLMETVSPHSDRGAAQGLSQDREALKKKLGRAIEHTTGCLVADWLEKYEARQKQFRDRCNLQEKIIKREMERCKSAETDTGKSVSRMEESKPAVNMVEVGEETSKTQAAIKRKKRKGPSKSAGKCRRPLCR